MSVLCFFEGAIKIPTVSRSPEDLNTTAMAEFGSYIRKGTELSVLATSAALFHFHKQRQHVSFLNIKEQIFFLKKGLSEMSHICPLCNSILGVSVAPKKFFVMMSFGP